MKKWYLSWTIWFGVCQMALGIIGLLSGQMSAPEALTLITTGLGTVGLRFKTTGPVI